VEGVAEVPAIDQYIQTNNGSVYQTIINNTGVDEETKQQVRRLAVASPEMLSKLNTMLKDSGDVKAAAAIVREASDILTSVASGPTRFTDDGDDPMFPGKGERELRKAVAVPFVVLILVAVLILWL
jgi:predicted RND superfamily exporter protein